MTVPMAVRRRVAAATVAVVTAIAPTVIRTAPAFRRRAGRAR
jgi:hypothetical protein